MSRWLPCVIAGLVVAPAGVAAAQSAPTQSPQTQAAPAQGAPAPKTDAKKPDAKAKEPKSTTVEGVTVTAQDTVRSSIEKRSYDVSKDLQVSTGSVADVLRNVPQVEVDLQGNVSLRGDSNVTIMVDGKPSAMMKGPNAGQVLQSMPAGQIARVEVITNPSAAYSPDGTAGIINLVTKATTKPGVTAGARAAIGSGGRYNGGVNGSWKRGKLSLSGDASIRHDLQITEVLDSRDGTNPGGGSFSTRSPSNSRGAADSRLARTSLDYDVNPKLRLSAETHFNGLDYHQGSTSQLFSGVSPTTLVDVFDRSGAFDLTRNNVGASTSLRQVFPGDEHTLLASLTADRTYDDRRQHYNDFGPANVPPTTFERLRTEDVQDVEQFKVDYTRPTGKMGKLKLGVDLQGTQQRTDNTGVRGPTEATAVNDPTRTDLFLFHQTVNAAYVTYEQPIGKLTVLGGLRVEDVRITADDRTSAQRNENNYTRLYPTLHLGWQLDDHQQLGASYSKRVQRPFSGDFNPFRQIIDPFNLRAGNPNLQPQITQSYEGSWQYRAGPAFYLATLFYRQNEKGFTDVSRDIGGGVILTTKENLTAGRNGGLEFVANGRLLKNVTYSASGNVAWTEIDATGLGFAGTRSATSVSGRGTVNWQVTPKDLVQWNGFMQGKQLTAQGYRAPLGGMNIGYRHKFDDHLSLVMTSQDPFGILHFRQVIDTPVLHERVDVQPKVRAFFIGFAYTFAGRGGREQQFDYGSPTGGPGG